MDAEQRAAPVDSEGRPVIPKPPIVDRHGSHLDRGTAERAGQNQIGFVRQHDDGLEAGNGASDIGVGRLARFLAAEIRRRVRRPCHPTAPVRMPLAWHLKSTTLRCAHRILVAARDDSPIGQCATGRYDGSET